MTDEEKKAIEWLRSDMVWCAKHIEDIETSQEDEKYKKEEIRLTQIDLDNEYILDKLIEKQQNKIKQQADLLRQANFIIECDEKTHDYDVKMIDEVKGRAVKYYDVIEDMAKELTNFLEETEEDIIKQFTRGRGL